MLTFTPTANFFESPINLKADGWWEKARALAENPHRYRDNISISSSNIHTEKLKLVGAEGRAFPI